MIHVHALISDMIQSCDIKIIKKCFKWRGPAHSFQSISGHFIFFGPIFCYITGNIGGVLFKEIGKGVSVDIMNMIYYIKLVVMLGMWNWKDPFGPHYEVMGMQFNIGLNIAWM